MTEKVEFSKYERARIIGARALQISMDAPLLMDLKEDELEGMNYDPLMIAEKELDSGVLPISIKRPVPLTTGNELGAIKLEEAGSSDEESVKKEEAEVRDVAESGEIMELANTEEDIEDPESVKSDDASSDE